MGKKAKITTYSFNRGDILGREYPFIKKPIDYKYKVYSETNKEKQILYADTLMGIADGICYLQSELVPLEGIKVINQVNGSEVPMERLIADIISLTDIIRQW